MPTTKPPTWFKLEWDKVNWTAVKAHLESFVPKVNDLVVQYAKENPPWSFVVRLIEQPNIKHPFHIKIVLWIKPASKPKRSSKFYASGIPYNYYVELTPQEIASTEAFIATLVRETRLDWKRKKLG